ncbi:hypothetical protein QYF36_026027 [Acer negundo]|nr:hypothetical protein QYF36_026027 [Acer negundo]
MTVGEVFLSAFLQVLFDRLASHEVLEFATGLKIDAELKKLALLMSKTNVLLKDIEVKQVKDMAIKLWIDELQDVVDDAEDALDEFSSEILKCNLEAHRNNVFSPLNPVRAVFFNMQVDSKIKAITKRLEGIAKQTVELGLREDVGEKSFRLWQSVGLEFYSGGHNFSVKPFQSLKILKVKNMPLWEEWFLSGVAEFPLLYELCIENCPRLEKILGSLASLKTLEIRNCKKLSCIPCLPHIQNLVLEECDQVIMNSVTDLASLEKLCLDKILNLKCIPSEFFHSFTALCDLQVANCDELMVLSDQFGLAHHTCLRRLTISKRSFMFLWPEKKEALPHLLECLEISYYYNLIQIPPGILSLKSFKILNINNCPKLSSLPEMNSPSNLRHLEIKECQALPFLPDGLIRNENLSLEFLVIDGCSSLKSFPDGDLPVTLHHLQISNCPQLNVLPTSNSPASNSNSSSSLKVLEGFPAQPDVPFDI